jgi:hypothetical protein
LAPQPEDKMSHRSYCGWCAHNDYRKVYARAYYKVTVFRRSTGVRATGGSSPTQIVPFSPVESPPDNASYKVSVRFMRSRFARFGILIVRPSSRKRVTRRVTLHLAEEQTKTLNGAYANAIGTRRSAHARP